MGKGDKNYYTEERTVENSSPITLTTEYQTFGFIDVREYRLCLLGIDYVPGTSTGITVKVTGATSQDGTYRDLPIKNVTSSLVELAPNVFSLSSLSTGMWNEFVIHQEFFIKIEIKANVPGATPCVVSNIVYTLR